MQPAIFIFVAVQILNSLGASLQREDGEASAPITCTTKDGSPGECVLNDLCDRYTNVIIEDLSELLDPRMNEEPECPSSTICCKVAETQNPPPQPALPNTRLPRDMTKNGCGYRNVAGVNVPLNLYDNLDNVYAKPGEFPWTVGVMQLHSRIKHDAFFVYLGGGALIHERAVLTAAHIFHGLNTNNASSFYVVIGDYDQNSRNMLPRTAVLVKSVVIHEGYDMNLSNDFALVILTNPVQVSGHVSPICLPPPVLEAAGSRCFSSGWGNNGREIHQYIMNKAELPLVDRQTCQSQLRQIPELTSNYVLHNSFICAGGQTRSDSCKGSGGSPLVCPMEGQPDRYVLTGLVAWSNNCSLDGLPSVYARVSTAREWIVDKMAANGLTVVTV